MVSNTIKIGIIFITVNIKQDGKMKEKPLAERLRPQIIDEVVGQEELLSEGKPLYQMVKNRKLHSMILWGPPGVGKTTLAYLLAKAVDGEVIKINAISSGVKEIREAVKRAEELRLYSRPVVLFIDEIHRFNKAQQDALLEPVEKGVFILIGTTTENPSFSVIPPLLSRCRVFQLKPLGEEALNRLIDRALSEDRILSKLNITRIDRDALIRYSGGDGRVLLNIIEAVVGLQEGKKEIEITEKLIRDVSQKPHIIYDRDGDLHYALISAFIKSVRGSDPDAAVYYLARMLEGGEDPVFIARRLVILASEDVGNAEPYALTLATSCLTAVQNIGMPEAKIILSQVTTYLASCPKSNSAYRAINEAIVDVRKHPDTPVPPHLINPSTPLMEKMGYGRGYRYSHDYEGNFVQQQYLPDRLKGRVYYRPTENGREAKIKQWLKKLWKGLKRYD